MSRILSRTFFAMATSALLLGAIPALAGDGDDQGENETEGAAGPLDPCRSSIPPRSVPSPPSWWAAALCWRVGAARRELLASSSSGGNAQRLRWALPAGLLLVEYLTLSLLVDLPTDGSAGGLVSALRLAVPVVLAACAIGWLMARHGSGRLSPATPVSPPPWRPWPALVLQPVAFALTAALAWKLLDPEPRRSPAQRWPA